MAQKRTEFAVKDLAKQVGGLSNAFGGSLEDFACDLVPEILEKHWRLVVASAQPEEIETGLGQHEMDLVVRGTIDGRPVVVVCEVKATVTATEVGRFLKTIERLRIIFAFRRGSGYPRPVGRASKQANSSPCRPPHTPFG